MEYKNVLRNVDIDKSIIKFEIPNYINIIDNSSFDQCYYLEEIIIPNSVEKIEAFAFHGCSELNNVIIPKSVKSIGVGSFSYCKKLTNFKILNPNIEFYSSLLIKAPFDKTPFERVYKKLNTKEFIKFVNDKDKFKWIGKYNIEINDIKDLLGEEYKGYKEGINYGI